MKHLTTVTKYTLYFWLAVLPALLVAKQMPQDAWSWWTWAGYAIYQGLLAMKALQSNPRSSVKPSAKV